MSLNFSVKLAQSEILVCYFSDLVERYSKCVISRIQSVSEDCLTRTFGETFFRLHETVVWNVFPIAFIMNFALSEISVSRFSDLINL